MAAPPRSHSGAPPNEIVRYQSLFRPSVNSFNRFCSSKIGVESVDFDLSDEESKRRLVNRFGFHLVTVINVTNNGLGFRFF